MQIARLSQAKLRKGADRLQVPQCLLTGLERYLEYGNHPGGFMQAVLTNDLFDAVQRADDTSLPFLSEVCELVYNCVDGRAWGDREKVDAWMEHHGYAGVGF